MNIGINPSFNTPFARQILFADAFLRAREIDPALTRLFGDMDGSIPSGTYTVSWDPGTQNAALVGSCVVRDQNRVPNSVEYIIDGTKGNALGVRWDGTGAGLRVIVGLPWQVQSPLYGPFVDLLLRQNSGHGPAVLRTLDYSMVNRTGADGPTIDAPIAPYEPQGTHRGVALEHQIELANQLRCDLHLNLPHPSTLGQTAYLKCVYTLVQRALRLLRPDLRLWLEVSNEAWNSDFPINAWLVEHAGEKSLRPSEVYGRLCNLVFQAARYAARATPTRLLCFVGGSLGDPTWLDAVLTQIQTKPDAAGPAGYFGPTKADRDRWGQTGVPGETELLDSCLVRIEEMRSKIRAHRMILTRHHVPLFHLYEAGEGFPAGFLAWGQTARKAQSNPRMEECYRKLLQMVDEEAVDGLNWYSFMADPTPPPPTDPFGMLSKMNEDPALSPKGRVFLKP